MENHEEGEKTQTELHQPGHGKRPFRNMKWMVDNGLEENGQSRCTKAGPTFCL